MSIWPDSHDTAELLGKAGEDRAALEALLERHRAPLRKMIGARLDPAIGRRVDASDIVQEVLWKASRRMGDYLRDPSLPFHLWLRQIARDHIVDGYRRHRQAERRSIDRERSLSARAFEDRSSIELAASLRDPEPTPAAEAIRQELRRRFQEAIARLNPSDREILLMRHFEQMSNQDSARALGLSESAAGMRYLRALRRLREVLGEEPSAGKP